MKKILSLSLLASALLLSACDRIPPEAYYNRGAPESLLDQSSEVVNFNVDSPAGIDELVDWVNQDQPTRAELYCTDGSALCLEAHDVLLQFGVDVLFVPSDDNVVTLIYDRVLARDCENRYIDNSINDYNLNHPTYGCSMASNMLQMVTDKRQFTSPALLDFPGAQRIDRAMRGYEKPYRVYPPIIDPSFTRSGRTRSATASISTQ